MTATINASTTAGVVTTADTSGILQLQTNGTAALTVDASQNVGIGTASPSAPLDIVSNSVTSAIGIRGRSSDNVGSIRYYTNNNATQYAYLRSDAGDFRIATVQSVPLIFLTNNTERARLNTTGAFVLAGGTTTADGIGITFPATQSASSDANTLDDYEEGTWTPTQGAGLTVVGTFSSTGFYTKIGRQVTVIGRVSATTSVAATANNILCAGLPFTSAAQVSIGASTNSALSQVGSAYIEAGTSVYSTAMSATTNIFFTVTYFV